MPNAGLGRVVRRLREMALVDGAGLSDGELLERYVCHREEAAFTALVRIHGPMVLGVCRRLLRDTHDADDAFQATFLVLVRKAHAVVPRERIGAWLYGVAYRTSLRAKAMANRRRAKQKTLEDVPSPPADPESEWLALLDHEIMRLPEKYRVPLVLCDLERKTRKQAARQIGCPEGTLATRLRHARALVQKRLARHGLTLSAGAVAVTWTHAVSAAVPSSLLAATVSNASLFTAGKIAGLIPLPIIALAEGVVKAMVLTKVKTIGTVLVLVSALGLGVVGMAGGSRFAATAQTPVAKAKAVSPVRPTIIEENNGLLPLGPAPVQALASLDKDKVVIRTNLSVRRIKEGVDELGHKVKFYESSHKLGARRYNLEDIEVYDTHLRRLKTMDLAKWLIVEQDPYDAVSTNITPRPIMGTPILLLYGSGDIDPLHLRLFKEGTLLLVVPQSGPSWSEISEPPPPGVIPLPNPPAASLPPTSEAPTKEQILDYLNDNARRVQSLRFADVELTVTQGPKSFGLRGTMVSEKPRNFRLSTRTLGNPVVDLGSNDQEFWYWIHKAETPNLVYCSYKDLSDGRVSRMPWPFQPEWVMESLGLGTYGPPEKHELEYDADTIKLVKKSTSLQGTPVRTVIVLKRAAVPFPRPQITDYLLLDDASGKEICGAAYQRSSNRPRHRRHRAQTHRITLAVRETDPGLAPGRTNAQPADPAPDVYAPDDAERSVIQPRPHGD